MHLFSIPLRSQGSNPPQETVTEVTESCHGSEVLRGLDVLIGKPWTRRQKLGIGPGPAKKNDRRPPY